MELLGAGGTVLLFGWFAGEGSLMSIISKNSNGGNSGSGGNGGGSGTAQLAYAQSSGSWLPVQSSTSTVAIHTALTRPVKYSIWLDLDGILTIGMDLIQLDY